MARVAIDVRLVAMGEAHLEATLRWMGDPALRALVDSQNEPIREGHAAYWHARWAETRREDYAVLDSQGQHVGNAGLCNIDPIRRKAELWIYLGVERGTGIGTSAVQLLLSRAFGELGLNRVYLRVIANNLGAERFWRRLGFVIEGRARADTWQDGVAVDSLYFSVLASEYQR